MVVKVGQRWSYHNSGETKIRFIVEVEKIVDGKHQNVKLIQVIDWPEKLGYVYTNQNLLGEYRYWQYLEGQDRPEA